MAALNMYLNNWVLIKSALLISWGLILTAMHCVNEYEYCVNILINCIYITFVAFVCLDVQFTFLAVIGIERGILGTHMMAPYIKYIEIVAVITLFMATAALLMSLPFHYVCPLLQLRSFYLFSYATIHYTLIPVGIVWILFNWTMARRILGYKQRQDRERAVCVYIRQTAVGNTEDPRTAEGADISADEGTASIVTIPTISQ